MKKGRNKIGLTEINSDVKFGTFYNAYYNRFVRYGYYYLNDWETAKDITHDAILYYWENRHKISPETDVLGYILLTVRNKCLNHMKHLQVRKAYNENETKLHEWEIQARIMTLEESSYSEIFTKEIMKKLTTSLSKLPKQTQDIFIQNRLKNKPRKEIAAEMGVSVQKIDYHINKASDHIYRELKEYLPFALFILLKIF